MDLLLLPGLHGTGAFFERFVDALPDHLTARAITYPPDRELGYAELLESVRRSAPPRPYAVLGESFGGPLALMHAAARPPHLRAVVLSAAFAANPAPFGLAPLLRSLGSLPFRWTRPRWSVRLVLAGRDAPDDLVDEVREAIGFPQPRVLAHRLRSVLAVDVRALLPGIGIPVLYLLGTRDRLIGRRGLRQIEGRLPRLRVAQFDAPHIVLQRRPRESAAEIEAFLRGG